MRRRALALPLALLLLSSWSCGSGGPASTKLVVLIVVDQMRADFLTRFEDLYGEESQVVPALLKMFK